jgi:hypothetical protein
MVKCVNRAFSGLAVADIDVFIPTTRGGSAIKYSDRGYSDNYGSIRVVPMPRRDCGRVFAQAIG